MMNNGLNGLEIAERLKLPDVLAKRWFIRGNYGTTGSNAKAIYQRYLGWYDFRITRKLADEFSFSFGTPGGLFFADEL
jgi:alkyl sulfatase BDS1-like metallo-beta-lactamase superfamily hydrolase